MLLREEGLRRQGFGDVYKSVKFLENVRALAMLTDVLRCTFCSATASSIKDSADQAFQILHPQIQPVIFVDGKVQSQDSVPVTLTVVGQVLLLQWIIVLVVMTCTLLYLGRMTVTWVVGVDERGSLASASWHQWFVPIPNACLQQSQSTCMGHTAFVEVQL